jgi:hypothetical protein
VGLRLALPVEASEPRPGGLCTWSPLVLDDVPALAARQLAARVLNALPGDGHGVDLVAGRHDQMGDRVEDRGGTAEQSVDNGAAARARSRADAQAEPPPEGRKQTTLLVVLEESSVCRETLILGRTGRTLFRDGRAQPAARVQMPGCAAVAAVSEGRAEGRRPCRRRFTVRVERGRRGRRQGPCSAGRAILPAGARRRCSWGPVAARGTGLPRRRPHGGRCAPVRGRARPCPQDRQPGTPRPESPQLVARVPRSSRIGLAAHVPRGPGHTSAPGNVGAATKRWVRPPTLAPPWTTARLPAPA